MAGAIDLSSNPFVPPEDGRCLINKLPSELLVLIFTHGWAEEREGNDDEEEFEDVASDDGSERSLTVGDLQGGVRFSQSPPPGQAERTTEEKVPRLPFNVLVSHICRRWRAVAIDNTRLWSYIQFKGPSLYHQAKTYLERAKTTPLSISIDRTNHSLAEDRAAIQGNVRDLAWIRNIMGLITPHVAHWRVLQVMVSFHREMRCVLEALASAGPAPLLEDLLLYDHRVSEHYLIPPPDRPEQPLRLFGAEAPRLTHVKLSGVYIRWDQEGSPFLAGLQDLQLAFHEPYARPSFYDFARILRSSPDLKALSLCVSGPAEPLSGWPASGMPDAPPVEGEVDLDAGAPLVLPKLTALHLAGLEQSYLLGLLPRLSLPALTCMNLDLAEDEYTDFLRYLASPRSLPSPPASQLAGSASAAGAAPATKARSLLSNLTSLTIEGVPARKAAVLDAYRQLGSLTELVLKAASLNAWWIKLLLPRTGAGEPLLLLLPRLKDLSVSGVDGARLRRLLEARAAHGAPLRTLAVCKDDYVKEEDERWFVEHLDRFELFEEDDETGRGGIIGEMMRFGGGWGGGLDDGDDDDDDDDGEDGDDGGPGGGHGGGGRSFVFSRSFGSDWTVTIR
ncbi:hypothetical protein C8Q77DRAFT_1210436 [Trametes polyzona]|nr:hypothetical protein C8Q77DRAFT_1210436 [Trametes polyzona]